VPSSVTLQMIKVPTQLEYEMFLEPVEAPHPHLTALHLDVNLSGEGASGCLFSPSDTAFASESSHHLSHYYSNSQVSSRDLR